MVIHLRSIFVSCSIAAVLLLAQCRGNGGTSDATVGDVKPASTVFQEPQGRFELTIVGQAAIRTTDAGTSTVHEFVERNKQNEIVTVVRITVRPSSGQADLFAGGYEDAFFQECNCTLVQKGLVQYLGQMSREYTLSLKNGEWTGFQRHTAKDTNYYIIEVSGPSGDATRLRAFFDFTISTFHFTAPKDKESSRG